MIDELDRLGYKVRETYTVRLPTYMNVSKTTTKALNLNIYRNLHHHHLHTQKQNFHEEVKPLLRGIPKAEHIAIHYTIYAARNGRLDTMNVGSIVDKYFSDTMVEAKRIPDDDYTHIVRVSFSFGGVCSLNGHATAEIMILDKKENNMRVMLDESDIQTALENYVAESGITGATGVEITVQGNSIEAEVQFGEVSETKEETTKPKSRGGRPRGSKNKTKDAPVKEDANADEPTEAGSSDSNQGDSGQPEGDSKAGSAKENLFGEEESQSSDSKEEVVPNETETPKPTVKKSSIFDED